MKNRKLKLKLDFFVQKFFKHFTEILLHICIIHIALYRCIVLMQQKNYVISVSVFAEVENGSVTNESVQSNAVNIFYFYMLLTYILKKQ